MACPNCRHEGLVTIGMSLGGSCVTFHCCSVCERRWWSHGDDQVTLDEVLRLAAA